MASKKEKAFRLDDAPYMPVYKAPCGDSIPSIVSTELSNSCVVSEVSDLLNFV
jgi:hypothetical protein